MHHIIGQEVRDKITGFKGVATGHVEYISGCNQTLIMPKMGKDGKAPEGVWYDDQRIEVIGKKRVVLDNSATPGPDLAAPTRS